jgi:DNA gyrase subunit A
MRWVALSATGRLAQVELTAPMNVARANLVPTRVDHDVLRSWASADDGYVGAISSQGTAYRLGLSDLPALAPSGPWSLWDGPLATDLLPLEDGEHVIGLYSLDVDAPPLTLGTRRGTVKRVVPEYKGWDSWQVMSVKDDDEIVGSGVAADGDDLVFITTDAQLLRLSAREARPQGRAAGGMAGIRLAEGSEVIFFGAVSRDERDNVIVATMAAGTDSPATVKTSAFDQYPAKGRATGGVRTHRFLKGQRHLTLAWAGSAPVRACDAQGAPRNLPTCDDRRDGAGAKVYGPFYAFG